MRVAPGRSANARSNRRGELLVIDGGVDAFAVDHVCHRRPGEGRFQQHHVEPIRLAATSVSTNPRWLRHMIPMTFG